MAYQIIKSDGSLLLELADGFTDSASSSITFIGKNYSKFGEIQNDNFLHLLENFAKTTEPANKLKGQLWFDSTTVTNTLKVFNGSQWQPLAVVSYGTTANAPMQSNLWFNTTTNQLFINNGSGFSLIGPDVVVNNSSTTRTVSSILIDTDGHQHAVITSEVDGHILSITSNDEFIITATTVISGFSHIYKGITLKNGNDAESTDSTLIGTSKYATNATALRNETGDAYLYASALNMPNTIVQRDALGSIEVTEVQATNISGTPNGTISGTWSVSDGFNPDTNGGANLGTDELRWSDIFSERIAVTTLNAETSSFIQLKDSNFLYITQFDNDTGLSADSGNRLPTQHAVKYYVDNQITYLQNEFNSIPTGSIPVTANAVLKRDASGSGFVNTLTATTLSLTGSPATRINQFDPDTTLAANSDLRLPTQKAVKFYVDNLIGNVQDEVNGASVTPVANTIVKRDGTARIFGGIVSQNISTGSTSTAGTITGNWTLTAGSRLQATYADLAENYLPDQQYEVGTVVMIGGEKEITAATSGSRAIGVISDSYAYLLNAELEGSQAVGLVGRVPVKVIGAVTKGDRLVAADTGYATVGTGNDVFAIALETNSDIALKIVEAIVL